MFFVASTLCLVAALAVNHLVHGFGCWGLQPGGRTSALIYDLQILTALSGIVWLAYAMAWRRMPRNRSRLMIIGVWAIASAVSYMLVGWKAHTSSHRFGSESLVAFLTVAGASLAIGTYGWWSRSDAPDDQRLSLVEGDCETNEAQLQFSLWSVMLTMVLVAAGLSLARVNIDQVQLSLAPGEPHTDEICLSFMLGWGIVIVVYAFVSSRTHDRLIKPASIGLAALSIIGVVFNFCYYFWIQRNS